jgi:hypothetical protein
LDTEELEEYELERLRTDYEELASKARKDLDAGKTDTEVRETKQRAIDEQEHERKKRK